MFESLLITFFGIIGLMFYLILNYVIVIEFPAQDIKYYYLTKKTTKEWEE